MIDDFDAVVAQPPPFEVAGDALLTESMDITSRLFFACYVRVATEGALRMPR